MGNDLPSGPLPSFINTKLQGNALQAYKACLVFERYADGDDLEVLYARILGYLILHAPSPFALEEISRTISSCGKNFEELAHLGKTFLDFLIWPFKRPKVSLAPRPSGLQSRDFVRDILIAAHGTCRIPADHKNAKIQALVRDQYRCVITARYDSAAADIPGLLDHDNDPLRTGVSPTHCAHIVPDSNYFNKDVHPDADDFAKSVSTVLRCLLTKLDVIDKLSGSHIHSLYNVMTMEMNVLDWFYRLELWFEATPTPNRYRIQTKNSFLRVPKEIITLKSSRPNLLPLPDPELLALHATAAKVAFSSGANRYIDKILEDMEDFGVLEPDGGSLDILYHAILRSSSTGFMSVRMDNSE
ncbi:hypothetical protein D9757_014857 [Collybiopsis confluens]|uniref:HNH nuclease domain-containing protein n=1 Tax=Collybiopsis confluens TaxID=2823264 RepID=A0A8H5FJN5_9AGAR|nr:hypothetical protein D9757_014857 [Collybiopsis confluens]